MRQVGFSFLKSYKKEFGGSLLVGKRKTRRPISTKHPIHLVLKTNGAKVFLPNQNWIQNLIRGECSRFGIKLYDFAPNWTHIHLLIRISKREDYIKFIRSLNSQIVLKLSKIKGEKMKGLFNLRPYTKIISWGRQFKRTLDYQILNQIESIGGKKARQEFAFANRPSGGTGTRPRRTRTQADGA